MIHGLSPNIPRPQQQVDINPDVPAYLVIEKRGFFDDNDHLWAKGEMIYWEGTPNPGFEPLNELAEDKLRDYFMMLDEKADEVCKLKGTGHASLVNAFEAKRRIQELDKRWERSVDIEEDLPIMRAKHHGKKLARSINDVQRTTPMMGHKGRYAVAEKQARGKERATKESTEKTED